MSNSSLGSLVNAYLRRIISNPKMAKREAAVARDNSVRSGRSVAGSDAEEGEDTDDTDVLYV